MWNGHADFHIQLGDGEVSVCDKLALLALIREAELLSQRILQFRALSKGSWWLLSWVKLVEEWDKVSLSLNPLIIYEDLAYVE